MNSYNLIGYLVYLPVTFYITVFVGRSFFRSGALFLVESFNGDKELANTFNLMLLVGYYLLNLGYAALSINFWNEIQTFIQLVDELSLRLGFLICGLAVMHYFNLYTFSHFSKQLQALYTKHK